MRCGSGLHAGSGIALLLLGVLVLSAMPASAEDLTLVERASSDTVTDLGAKGDSVGDLLTFANDLFDAGNATKAGTDNGSCVRTAAGKAWECAWTNTLAKGQINVAGTFLDGADSVLAVTGGTGEYAGARGEMGLHARDAQGSAYDFKFKISR